MTIADVCAAPLRPSNSAVNSMCENVGVFPGAPRRFRGEVCTNGLQAIELTRRNIMYFIHGVGENTRATACQPA